MSSSGSLGIDDRLLEETPGAHVIGAHRVGGHVARGEVLDQVTMRPSGEIASKLKSPLSVMWRRSSSRLASTTANVVCLRG